MSETQAATEELRRALAAEEGGKRWLRRLAVAGSVIVVVGAGIGWRVTHRPAPPPKYRTSTLATEDIAEKVQATGAVQPVLQVSVGAQVTGVVKQVLVDFNTVVHKGDVLAVIDPEVYTTQVTSQEANLMAQRAQEDNARAAIETARANRDLAKAVLTRTQRLFADKLASQGDLDTAKGTFDANTALYDQSIAALAGQKAQVMAQTSQLRQVNANLGYTKIYAPVDGVVVTRSIDPGATVIGSFQAPVLFVIAQDLSKMRVLADVDEADVGKLKEGMDADAVVDAFPGETFHGVVGQVRFSPNTVSGVVTYSAVIDVANPDSKLRPGMTATVTIRTREVKQAKGIPNSALRYKPTPPKGPDDKPIPQPPQPPLAKGQGRVWVMTSEKPGDEKAEERLIAIGITDGLNTEVQPGALPDGTKVVTDENDEKKKKLF